MERKLRAGTRISHSSRGDGIVLASNVQDDDELVNVDFESAGIKHLAKSLANLKLL